MNTPISQSNVPVTSVDVYSGGPSTPEYMMAIIRAAAEGRKIQYKIGGYPWTDDISIERTKCGKFNWVNYVYRVDPADRPKVKVPLDVEDFGSITWLRGPLIVGERMIVGIRGGWLELAGENSVYRWKDYDLGEAKIVNGNWIACMTMFDQNVKRGTHEYSTDRKTWRPTHKEVMAD